jgi:hypothetical protein
MEIAFPNADLELSSRHPLDPPIEAFGEDVVPTRYTRGGEHFASLETAEQFDHPGPR